MNSDLAAKNIPDLINLIGKRLKEQYGAKEVILFGSYARGDAHEDSDIDLFIIAETKERFFIRMATVLTIVDDLIKKIPFSPIVLTPDEVSDRTKIGDQFIAEILNEGIRI